MSTTKTAQEAINVLTDETYDVSAFKSTLNAAVSNYLHLLVYIEMCIENNYVPQQEDVTGFTQFYGFNDLVKLIDKNL